MIDLANIRQGMQVYGDNNQPFGTIERVSGQDVYINGQRYPLSSFSRLEQNRLYMSNGQSAGVSQQSAADTIRVPVVEEQLNVSKREVELGQVELQKNVTQQQVNVPVELRREEVNVQEVDVPDRPVAANEANTAFQEGTIRVPVRGEEAVANKQAVVTGEVVVNKDVTTEQQQISDTVRKEHVTVDNNTTQTRPQTQAQVRPQVQPQTQVQAQVPQQPVTRQADTAATYGTDRTNVSAVGTEAYMSSSTTDGAAGAASYDQSQIQENMEVYSSDNHHLGKVKEATSSYFLVGRGLFKGDIEARYESIQEVQDDNIILNLTKDQVDDLT